MSRSNKFHPLKLLAVGGYVLGVTSLVLAMVLGITPASATFAQEAISCPLSSGTIVNISNGPFIRSDRSAGEAEIGPLSVSIPAGIYAVTLVSYDNHTAHVGPDQPSESWVLILQDSGGSEITRSQPIADLPGPDNWITQQTNAHLTVSANVASVLAYHAAYPSGDTPNSIVPVCASFVALQVEPTPTNTPELPTNTPVPPTPTSTLVPPTPTSTSIPPTVPPDSTATPELPTSTPDPTDPAPTSVPPTSVPPTDVPPPQPTSPSVLIPVTGIDLGGSRLMMKGLFSDLGMAFLGFGLLMHGAYMRFGKEE